MRQFILIAAMLLISASARADGLRGLSLASNSETTIDAAPRQPKPDQGQTARAKAEKPKRTRPSVEAEVINGLHRHGVYW